MFNLIKIALVLAAGYYGYLYFQGELITTTDALTAQNKAAETAQKASRKNENAARQTDMQAVSKHLNSLGPYLQTMRPGVHSFVAPSSTVYRYEVKKSGLYYCPKRRQNIYRNIRVDLIDR